MVGITFLIMSLFTFKISDEEQYGPVGLDTLRAWAREGRIAPNDQIYDHTQSKWMEAASVSHLADFYQSQNGTGAVPNPAHPGTKSTITKDMVRLNPADQKPHRPPTVVERLARLNIDKKSLKKGSQKLK
jgi:hypothetical protein